MQRFKNKVAIQKLGAYHSNSQYETSPIRSPQRPSKGGKWGLNST